MPSKSLKISGVLIEKLMILRPAGGLLFSSLGYGKYLIFSFCSPHRDRKDHRPNVYEPVRVPREPSKSNKVVNAYECIPAETINKCIDPYLSIQEKNDGGTVLADDMDSLLCFEDMQNGSFGKYLSGFMFL